MPLHLNPSESRTYIIVYGRPSHSASAAIKFKLPESLPNSVTTGANYFKKYLSPGEQVLTCTAFENLSFLKEIQDLPVWNHEELIEEGEDKEDVYAELAAEEQRYLDAETEELIEEGVAKEEIKEWKDGDGPETEEWEFKPPEESLEKTDIDDDY